MRQECNEDSCCPSHSHNHHENHEEESCDFSKHLLCLADEAWMEVLKEKIKENIIATNGKKMDELAKIISDANNSRWQAKMANKKCCNDFKEKIKNFFGSKS